MSYTSTSPRNIVEFFIQTFDHPRHAAADTLSNTPGPFGTALAGFFEAKTSMA